ncbi:uncharacterized protein LOC144735179 [Lampetra planeri]
MDSMRWTSPANRRESIRRNRIIASRAKGAAAAAAAAAATSRFAPPPVGRLELDPPRAVDWNDASVTWCPPPLARPCAVLRASPSATSAPPSPRPTPLSRASPPPPIVVIIIIISITDTFTTTITTVRSITNRSTHLRFTSPIILTHILHRYRLRHTRPSSIHPSPSSPPPPKSFIIHTPISITTRIHLHHHHHRPSSITPSLLPRYISSRYLPAGRGGGAGRDAVVMSAGEASPAQVENGAEAAETGGAGGASGGGGAGEAPVDPRELEEAFRRFALHGDPKASGAELNGKNWAKLCRDCRVADGKRVTATDVDIVFSKVKERTARVITVPQFLSALEELSRKRFPSREPEHALRGVHGLVAGGAPAIAGVTVRQQQHQQQQQHHHRQE